MYCVELSHRLLSHKLKKAPECMRTTAPNFRKKGLHAHGEKKGARALYTLVTDLSLLGSATNQNIIVVMESGGCLKMISLLWYGRFHVTLFAAGD